MMEARQVHHARGKVRDPKRLPSAGIKPGPRNERKISMAADQDYIKARHRLIPQALKITSEALGIGLTINHTNNTGEIGKGFDYAGFSGDPSKVMPVFLATMDQLYAEQQQSAA